MKTMTHEMSDDLAKRIEAALCDNYPEQISNPDYDRTEAVSKDNIPTMPNDKTKWQHACDMAGGMLMAKLSSFEGSKAQNIALAAKNDEISKLVITTN